MTKRVRNSRSRRKLLFLPLAAFLIVASLSVLPHGQAALSTGQAANLVLGQGGFGTATAATTQTGLNDPIGVAFDPSGDLWVVDVNNNRVLEYVAPFTTDEAASVVIGQTGFNSGAANAAFASCNGSPVVAGTVSACGLSNPIAVGFDSSGNLWVGDVNNNRVLEYAAPFSTGEAASLVIGQTSFAGGVANAAFASCNGSPVVAGTVSACGLSGPHNPAFDSSGNLWLSDFNNNRVLEYTHPFSNGEASSLVLGQPDFVTNTALNPTQSSLDAPFGVTFDSSGDLWVADQQNYRILEFQLSAGGTATGAQSSTTLQDTTKTWATNQWAGFVVTITSGTGSGQSRSVSSNNGNTLTVSLAWTTSPDGTSRYTIGTVPNGANAAIALSPPNFTTKGKGTSSTLFQNPRDVAFDASGNAWVADTTNDRLLEFAAPLSTGEAASVVIGQTGFNSGAANAAFASCNGSPVVAGTISACGLSTPRALAFDSSGNLWVDDASNNRILEYSSFAEAITPSPVAIDTGQAITLTSHNTGGIGPYTYQWYTAPGPGTCTTGDASLGAGGAASTYAVPSSTTPGTYNYCYVITDSTGATADSPTDAVTVHADTVGTITPASPTIDSGQMITLTSTAASGGTGSGFTYQWYSGTSATCSSDATALGAALTQAVSPISRTDYCVQVTDTGVTLGASPLFSSTDLVTVDLALDAAAITPTGPMIDVSQSVTLTASPSGGTAPYSYQWYTGAACTSPVEGRPRRRTRRRPSRPRPTIQGNGFCQRPCLGLFRGDTVTVNGALSAGAITPSSPMIDISQSVTLTANPVGGTGPFFYQWYTSSDCATSPIPGATSSTYDTGPLTAPATYYYKVTDSAHVPASACSAGDSVGEVPIPDTTGGVYLPAGSTFTYYGYNWTVPGGSVDGGVYSTYFFQGPQSDIPG